ncbi:hypothetical protein [uncultured Winogradskyella sp.]|uniref:hypothetical protein n=1 Tax=uncultured Winogradskyella sp. TaxID=395353 RepID=UPI00260AFDB9|nr:hypothetical protein [uncultured Winogradskyella sp.]
MKLNNVYIIILILLTKTSFSQQDYTQNSDAVNDISAPMESIYIDINGGLLFSGEYLYYSMFCFDTTTKNNSQMSKIVYVELIASNGDRIFKHKIKLDNGRGYADFFLPVTLNTGHYKLVAYTNWMRNGDFNNLGNANLTIINPYKSITSIEDTQVKIDSVSVNNLLKENKVIQLIGLKLNKERYGKRQKVVVELHDSLNNIGGSYSVSVKRKIDIPASEFRHTVDYYSRLKAQKIQFSKDDSNVFLPEFRGELFKGSIRHKGSDNKGNLKVAVSIAHDFNILNIAHTDISGNFYFNVDENYSTNKAYFQVLGENSQDYDVILEPKPELDISELKFETFRLNPEWKDFIIEQSVYNQVENAYFEFRSDSLSILLHDNLFKGRIYESYNLDDYNRFATLKETVQEIIKNTSIRKDNERQDVFEIQGFNFGTNTNIKPLLILDGVIVDNHSKMMDFNATTIKTVKIYRDQFVIDLEVFQGIINIETIGGLTTNEFINNGNIPSIQINKPQVKKTYYKQTYTNENRISRLPDFRQQLLWIPIFNVSENNKTISFFTSDVKGVYEIKLEGFTSNGKPVSILKEFEVN